MKTGQAKNPDKKRNRKGERHVGDFSENTAVFHTGMAERGSEEILWGPCRQEKRAFFRRR